MTENVLSHQPADDAKPFLLAVVLAAVLTVLYAWLWMVQDDIHLLRQRREFRLQQDPGTRVPRIPSRNETVIAAAAAEGEL